MQDAILSLILLSDYLSESFFNPEGKISNTIINILIAHHSITLSFRCSITFIKNSKLQCFFIECDISETKTRLSLKHES